MSHTPRTDAIRDRLNLVTMDLTHAEHFQAWKMVQQLSIRLTCEDWAIRHGVPIPAYGTVDWAEMEELWLSDGDDDLDFNADLNARAAQLIGGQS